MYAQFAQSQAPFLSLLGGLQPRRFQATQDPYAILSQLGAAPQFERAQFDAGDQQLIDSYARRNQGIDVMPNTALALPPAAQQPARRNRVSGWRVLDRVLGGDTISEGLDAERVREQQLADAPASRARLQRLGLLAAEMGPAAEIAFATNPEAFGESLGMQYRPVTTAEGSITSYGPRGRQIAAPVVDRFDDRYGIIDPLNPAAGVRYTDPRGATRAEITAQDRIALDRELGKDRIQLDQRRLEQSDQQFYDRLKQDQSQFDSRLNFDRETRPAGGAQSQEAVGQLQSLDTEVATALGQMRQLLESGQVITGFGAETRLTADRALAAAGNREAASRVAATEQYRNLSGRLRVGMAKSLGANPSNADILLLERVTAGDISQSREGLLATINDGEALAGRQRRALESRVRPQGAQSQRTPTPAEAAAELRRRGVPGY